jgi:hypothetical protein
MSYVPQPPAQPQPDPVVSAELRRMGLSSDHLREAVLDANQRALECTTNDVVGKAGYTRWEAPLRRLGDIYAPVGFTRERPKNFELLVHPDRMFALTTGPGDANTGTESMPATRIDRGPLTGQAVLGNRHQLSFGNIDDKFDDDVMPIWLLLTFYDEFAEEIRVELSLPVEFDAKPNKRGHVTAFEPRLVLPAITLNDMIDDDQDEDDGQIDVPVARR